MTDPTLAAIRQRHIDFVPSGDMLNVGRRICDYCSQDWPCDAITLLDRVAAAEGQLEAMIRCNHDNFEAYKSSQAKLAVYEERVKTFYTDRTTP